MMNSIRLVELLNVLRKNTKVSTKESEYKDAYDQLIFELRGLMSDADFENIYLKISYIRIELICIKELLATECNPATFYLNKAIYALDINLQVISWKISGLSLKPKNIEIVYNTGLQWTGSITELVELGYSLVESKRINNGEIKIKVFMTRLSVLLNIEIKDCFNIYREIRKRKYQRTAFLDILKDNLIQRMDKADNVYKR